MRKHQYERHDYHTITLLKLKNNDGFQPSYHLTLWSFGISNRHQSFFPNPQKKSFPNFAFYCMRPFNSLKEKKNQHRWQITNPSDLTQFKLDREGVVL